MFPGLLIGLALAAPPSPEVIGPGVPDSHKDALARFGTAVLNLRRDRLLTAVKQLEEAAKKDPDATAPLRELVRVYALIGREPDAIRLARRILEKDPHDFDVAHSLAQLLFDAGELKEAVAAAKLAAESPIPIARAEKAVGVYRDLATLCEKAKDPATAETAIRKAIELVVEKRKEVITSGAFTPREADTAAAECLERLGKILTKLQKYEEAATAFTSAAELYSSKSKANDPSAMAHLNWNLSGVLEAKGDPKAAIEYLESFLKLQPIIPEPYTRLAKLLRESGRELDVVRTLQKLDDNDPKNLALKAVLATEIAREGINDLKAHALFAKIMAETNDPKIVALIIRSHLEVGRAREIVTDLDHIFAKLKDNEKDEKSVDTPETAAAKTFAAEKARVIADILREDPDATTAVLQAVTEDLRLGTKRIHQTYYFLGQLAARHHKLQLADRLFRNAIRTAPKETRGDAYIGLIDVLRMAGKPAELADICRDGLQNVETVAPFYFNYFLSEALAELGKENENAAIAAADKAIQDTGHNNRLTIKLHKVSVLRILEKWDDAIALANKLLDEFPASADQLQTRHSLATTYWLAGKRAEAEAELRAILEIDPDFAPACNDLGFHLADLGRNLDEAERLIRNAIVVDKFDRRKSGAAELENAVYIDSLGWVLFRKGKLSEARIELERAVAFHEGASDPIVWDHLGDVLFRLGEKAKAKSAWEQSVVLCENDARLSTHRRDNRLDEVKRKLKQVP